MFKRILTAAAVLVIASAIVLFSAWRLPDISRNDYQSETILFQNNK